MLTTEIDRKDRSVYVRLSGRIDHDGVPAFQSVLDKVVGINPQVTMLDLTAVPFINSTGINYILLFYKRMLNRNADVRITGISDEVFTILKTIHLDRLIPIEK